MLGAIIAAVVGSVFKIAPGIANSYFDHLAKKADSETERLRIEAAREQHAQTTAAHVVTTGMAQPVFWIPWLIATVPLATWFGWGMLDTTVDGALPNVAEIPPGLRTWAESIWQTMFYSGAGVSGATVLAQAIARRK